MKKSAFLCLCLLLCFLCACGTADITTPATTPVTTTVTTTATKKPVVHITTRDPSVQVPQTPSVVPVVKRDAWNIEIDILKIGEYYMDFVIRDLDNLGFHCRYFYYRMERQNEDGTWSLLTPADSQPNPIDTLGFVNPKYVEGMTASLPSTLYFGEWGRPLPEGRYRLTKFLYNDIMETDCYEAKVEFTVPLA